MFQQDVVGINIYCLDLPAGTHIHLVFHVSLLEYIAYHQLLLDLVDANRELEYKVKEIIDF